jgi:hypothetical protein
MAFILEKMQSNVADTVQYFLPGFTDKPLNDLIGKEISIEHTGKFECIQCNRAIKKTFQQGYCYPCLRRLQECNLCIIHPERCRVMEGCCPENDWAHRQCHANHVIYLSYTSGLKVGITQVKNVPSRWVDQGAVAAAAFMTTSNRFLCGQVEVAFKEYVNDKTNWRTMLKESPEPPDLLAEWSRLIKHAKPALEALTQQYGESNIGFIKQPVVQNIAYPIERYPEKISSLSLDKTPVVSGLLQGIKGQYLYFEHGVMNVRKFGGYEVNFLTA